MPERTQRSRNGKSGMGAGALAALMVVGPGTVWAANFKSAPEAAEKGGEGQGTDTILGLIHVNTALFIAIAVFAVYWFLFGGGRKPNIGRKE